MWLILILFQSCYVQMVQNILVITYNYSLIVVSFCNIY